MFWERCFRIRRVMLITGERAMGDLMRRWVYGEWQYRLPTDDELKDQIARDAW